MNPKVVNASRWMLSTLVTALEIAGPFAAAQRYKRIVFLNYKAMREKNKGRFVRLVEKSTSEMTQIIVRTGINAGKSMRTITRLKVQSKKYYA